MSTRRRTQLLAAALAAALLAALTSAAASAAAHSGLHHQLERMTKAVGAPGAVLLVDNGRSVHRVAVGVADRRTRRPMPVDARFRVYSVTHIFVATVVLQLAAEGRLSLQDSVDRWLPGRIPDPEGVTIGRMLNHTSGINDFGIRYPVGPFYYAHNNFKLLGDVVEAVTASPLADELQRRIFAPLRLTDTSWPQRSTVRGLVRGYEHSNDMDATRRDPATLTATDALVSSARDLRRFLRGLFGGALLAPSELEAMRTFVSVESDPRQSPLEEGYGLGVLRNQTGCGVAWGHRGRGSGYSSFAFASPDGRRSVIALFNTGAALDPAALFVQHTMFRAYCTRR